MKFLFHDRIQKGDFTGGILGWTTNCHANNHLERIGQGKTFWRDLND